MHYVSADNPPFLILHGTADTLVPYAQSEALEAALKKAGVPVVLQPFPNAGHGGPAFARPAVLLMVNNFFARHLKDARIEIQPLPPSAVTAEA